MRLPDVSSRLLKVFFYIVYRIYIGKAFNRSEGKLKANEMKKVPLFEYEVPTTYRRRPTEWFDDDTKQTR